MSNGFRILTFPGFSLMSGSTWWKRREMEHSIPISGYSQQVAASTGRAGGKESHPHLLRAQPSCNLDRKRSTCSGVNACGTVALCCAVRVVCLMHQKSKLVCSVRLKLKKARRRRRRLMVVASPWLWSVTRDAGIGARRCLG